MLDFIKCDDKGDTTFLKVQIFSSVCTECQFRQPNKSHIGNYKVFIYFSRVNFILKFNKISIK